MTIVFVSNFINHHQKPVADELYRLTNGNYFFIATQAIPTSFLDAGYPDYSNLPYVLKAYEDEETYQEARDIADKADVVVLGAAPDSIIKKRIKNNKVTFYYSERFFKFPSILNVFRNIKLIFLHHSIYRFKRMYMLAAGAYVANDVRLVGAYPDKIFKWGYFTAVPDIDLDKILKDKRQKKIKIIWCARIIDWKHPELVPQLARKLVDNNITNFEIEMIGSGEEEYKTKQLIHKLNVEKYVNMSGNHPNAVVTQKMRDSNIFLFTSDRAEGWGAVLNEAMSSGCAVVASNEIGAVPYLIQHQINGLIFKSKSLESLYENVVNIINDKETCEKYARNAYETIKSTWSPQNAAESLVYVCRALLDNKLTFKESGPCSKAVII